jgi:glucokinase
MNPEYLVTIDMGGTKSLAALSRNGEIVGRLKRPTNVGEKSPDYGVELVDLTKALLAEHDLAESDARAVCLGVPGSVDQKTGVVGVAPNLGITDYPIREEMAKRLSIPVLIENDVNIAALGIMAEGSAGKTRHALVVFVGTGIGGALIIDGKLYRGADNFAGEIGHMRVRPGGPRCGCGAKGCFEAVASKTAIIRDVVAAIKDGKKSVLKERLDAGKRIKSKAIAKAIAADDKLAVKTVADACDVIGETLASVNNLLNLETIVLGGGLVEANEDFMLPIIREAFERESLKDFAKSCELRATALGDDAPLLGGEPLAAEYL